LISQNADGMLAVNYANMTPVLAEGIKELNLKIKGIQNFDTTDTTFANNLITWLGNQANGIVKIVAGTIKAKDQICVGERCITEAQFNELLDKNGISGGPNYQGQLPPQDPVVDDVLPPSEGQDTPQELPPQDPVIGNVPPQDEGQVTPQELPPQDGGTSTPQSE
jgi:hypothetical protein